MNFITIGVEKNNDDARRNYFSSNHHDPPKEILVTEYRLQTLAPFARQKRSYTKTDNQYWEKDIFSKRANNNSTL